MKDKVLEILDSGNMPKIKALFSFNKETDLDLIRKKFYYWSRYFFPHFFESKDADFHKLIDLGNIGIYINGDSFLDIAFRGAAKTSRTKLFIAFVIANDISHYRKYIKVLSKDISNAKQITTDVYNALISRRVKTLYPEIFQKTDIKREETMASFTTATGIKMTADSVGTDQRGDIQDESRPDFILMEDFETRMSLMSAQITHKIWLNMEEAKTGLAKDGGIIYNSNYISERGNTHKLVEKIKNKIIIPIEENGQPIWDRYTKDDIAKIKREAEDYEGEYLCLKPDTLIATDRGLREIKTLKVGDLVWTHLGRLQKILKVFQRQANDLLDITIEGKITTITKNHPVLVKRDNLPVWVTAGDLITTDLLLKIPHGKLMV